MKHHTKSLLVGLCLSLISTISHAAPLPLSELKADIAHEAKVLIKKYNPNMQVGISVMDLDDDRVLYEHNADQLFTPASNTKLFTAASALFYYKLGPKYEFKTKVVKSGSNLYVVFSGDPSLSLSQLNDLVKRTKRAGISEVNKVYVDSSAYAGTNWGPGWMWDEIQACYAAPISAILLDENCREIRIEPRKPGHRAALFYNRKYDFIPMVSDVMTRTPKDSRWCYINMNVDHDDKVYLQGCVASNAGPQYLSAAVANTVVYAEDALKSDFARAGIRVKGGFHSGTAPKEAKLIAEHSSKPLSVLIKHMLKVSDNVYANSIFKKLGNVYFNSPGTWSNGYDAMTKILKNSGVDFNQLSLVDGSGISRYTKISPNQFIKVLAYAYKQRNFKYFYDALPISGTDGTLIGRLYGKSVKGKVYAKTGSESGVSSLSGYVTTKNGKKLAFSIINNGFVGGLNHYRTFQDIFAGYLSKLDVG